MFSEILFFSLVFASPKAAEAEPAGVFSLKAQDVVDLVLKNSDEYKLIEIESELSRVDLLDVEGKYDFEISAEGSYEKSRADNVSGIQNIEDRNIHYGAGVSRLFSSGTEASVNYERIYQTSELQSFTQSLRDSSQVYDAIYFRLRQDLLKNAFGVSERARRQAAQFAVSRSSLQKKEAVERLLLDALSLFWSTYIAKEDLRYAILARDRYEKLVSSLGSKVKRELAERADLSRAQAELENKKREVKTISLVYLNMLQNLSRLLKIESSKTIELEVADTLPSPPDEELAKNLDSSRQVQAAQINLERSELVKKSAKWNTYPSLNLFGVAGYTGVGRDGSDSLSKVVGADRPVYEVGLAVSFNPFSSGNKAELLDSELSYRRAISDLSLAKSTTLNEQQVGLRNVQSKYVIAQSAIRTFEARERVVGEQERRYQRGLIGLSDLILDYNFYYSSQSSRSSAVADYYLARIEWEAAKDILVE